MARKKDKETCEEKKGIGEVIGDIGIYFVIITISLLVFMLGGSSILSRIKNNTAWDFPSNLHRKPYATSSQQWKNDYPPQSGGNPLLAGAAMSMAKQAAKSKMQQQRAKIGSGTRATSGLEFPYDLINGNEVADWFSRTVAMTQSKHNGWFKWSLSNLNKQMYPRDTKSFMAPVKKWSYLVLAWMILICSQFIWMYNTTLSWFEAWGPAWSNMWLYSETYPNSFIFHNIPFLSLITGSLLITFTSLYQYISGFLFLVCSAFFTDGAPSHWAFSIFINYFSYKGILFTILLIIALSTGLSCWNECIERGSKNTANSLGIGILVSCAILGILVYRKEFAKAAKSGVSKAASKTMSGVSKLNKNVGKFIGRKK
tara:strand:+ start:5806 stop:6915 length:1110 start_codon:yes stop_codon:yes gene_type:complete